MSYVNLLKLQRHAQEHGYAVGAFNIFSHLTAKAVVDESVERNAPLILQTSTKTVRQLGAREMMEYLLPLAQRAPVPVAVHLDHCRDVALAKECIDAGWSSIMLDGSHLPLEENIALTREVVGYARASGRDISVEGELGAIGGVEEDIAVSEEEECLAKVEDAVRYTRESGVDVFAPAIGTAHGLYKKTPHVSFARFAEIREAVSQPLVVHGGTGLSDETFRRLIGMGASKINISTAVKIAYLQGIRDYLAKDPEVSEPLKLDAYLEAEVRRCAGLHIELFGSGGHAWKEEEQGALRKVSV